MSAPYCVHRPTPANMPSRVACRQNPASPTLSSTTLSSRDSTKTCPDHNGEAARDHRRRDHTDHRRHPHRMRARTRHHLGVARRPHFARRLLKQAVGGPRHQTERAPEHTEHRETGRFEVSGRQVQHRVPAQRRQHGGGTDPCDAAASDRAGGGGRVGHSAGTSSGVQPRIPQRSQRHVRIVGRQAGEVVGHRGGMAMPGGPIPQ